MPQRENLLDVIGLFIKKRKILFQITAAVAVLSIIISLILPVYYKAETNFLAASPDLTNPSKLFSDKEIDVYGSGDDIERLMGIANSDEIFTFLIDSFNLYEVYDIDPESKQARNDVSVALAEMYSVVRTKYDAIKITIEDKDPVRAMRMANAARAQVAKALAKVSSNSKSEMAAMYQTAIKNKQGRLEQIKDSLRSLTNIYGIVDVESQGESLSGLLGSMERKITSDSVALANYRKLRLSSKLRDTVNVITARIEGNRMSRIQLLKQLDKFAKGSGPVKALQTEFEIVSKQLAYDLERYRQFNTDNSASGPVIHMLDEARVPDKKSRPIRWLIVVGSTLAAFIFSALGILLFDTYKDVNWKQYYTD